MLERLLFALHEGTVGSRREREDDTVERKLGPEKNPNQAPKIWRIDASTYLYIIARSKEEVMECAEEACRHQAHDMEFDFGTPEEIKKILPDMDNWGCPFAFDEGNCGIATVKEWMEWLKEDGVI